jgi:hypothetical protein
MKTNREWQKSIERALIDKGFRRKAARKTAKKTIQKSIAKQEREKLNSLNFTVRTEVINGQSVTIKVYPPCSTE